jgi:flagellar biosynthetic protein FlhB
VERDAARGGPLDQSSCEAALMAQSDLDRNQPATAHKLHKAREQGQVAKSPDVISAIVFAAAIVFLTSQGWTMWQEQIRFDRALLLQAARTELHIAVIWPVLETMLRSTLWLLAPLFGTLVCAAIVGNLIQSGPVLSSQPVTPDWNRLNPVDGLKRVFSMRTLFLALRAILKLVLLSIAVYVSLKALLPQFYHLAALAPRTLVRTLIDDFSSLGLKLAAVLAAIALLDLIYSRHEFAKKMRMSQREIKDEHKNREGDPRIRARLRELRREVLKRSMTLRNTQHADVLITNPTHVAVALRYVHGQMSSPQLLAKGKGPMAAVMRAIATRHRVPIVHSPSLARSLYRELAIEQHVPPDLYAPVARIVVWVFAQREAQAAARSGRRAGSAAEPAGSAA